jgi:hypothetical protein
MATYNGRVELLDGDQLVGRGFASLASASTRDGSLDWGGTITIHGRSAPRRWPNGVVTLRIAGGGAAARARVTNQRIVREGMIVFVTTNGDPPPF